MDGQDRGFCLSHDLRSGAPAGSKRRTAPNWMMREVVIFREPKNLSKPIILVANREQLKWASVVQSLVVSTSKTCK